MFGLSISEAQLSNWIERAVSATERIATALERIRDSFERNEEETQSIMVDFSDESDRS